MEARPSTYPLTRVSIGNERNVADAQLVANSRGRGWEVEGARQRIVDVVTDPVLTAFGVNLLSSAAFDVLSRAARERLRRDQRAFSKRVADFIRRQSGFELEVRTIERVLFQPDVWVAVLRGDPGQGSWNRYLHDLTRPGGPTAAEIADSLVDAVSACASRDLRIAIDQLTVAEELKEGQAAIYEELLQLRDRANALVATGEQSRVVAQSIRDHFAQADLAIDELTTEQFHVIRELHGIRRALVPGSAGSGKTVVACEKAIRLDSSGLRTLLLCHNPVLAIRLEAMTQGSGVEVHDFATWTAALARTQQFHEPSAWTRHDEPADVEIERALTGLLESEPQWDAVIVDEGQDFRDSWWLLVEAAVGEHGILFIFADDDQRLLSHRDYPSVREVYSMSRNCRNAGRVYSAMRGLVFGLSRPEERLSKLGDFDIFFGQAADLSKAIDEAAIHLGRPPTGQTTVLLSMDGKSDELVLRNGTLPLDPSPDWRAAVLGPLLTGIRASTHDAFLGPVAMDPVMTTLRGGPPTLSVSEAETLSARLTDGLSRRQLPTAADVDLVCATASRVLRGVRRQTSEHVARSVQVRPPSFSMSGGMLVLDDRGPFAYRLAKLMFYLASPGWVQGLPLISRATVVRGNANDLSGVSVTGKGEDVFAAFDISEFKGLEAHRVLVIWEPTLALDSAAELYVAVSRARLSVSVVAPDTWADSFPAHFLSSARTHWVSG